MTSFVSLEDAAKKLGISIEQLIEMRSRGEIFGYRDGASWKFKPEEIQRVAGEMFGDVLDEDPAGSSILNLDSDKQKGSSGLSSSSLSSVLGDQGSELSLQVDPESSDLRLVANSDVSLDPTSEGSGISDVDESGLRLANSDDDDDEISLASEDSDELIPELKSGASKSKPSSEDASGSDSDNQISLDSDLEIMSDSDAAISLDSGAKSSSVNLIDGSDLQLGDQSDLIRGDSDPNVGGGSSGVGSDLDLDKDLELEDDVVLGSGSDLALGADSGINLMSPADSGISLEDEPLDLAASGISGLEVSGEGSNVGGSGVDFQQDEDFQLSPSGGLEVDEDSGSQVIELEDSSEIGAAAPVGGLDDLGDVGGAADTAFDDADAFGEMAPTGVAVVQASPEVPYSTLQVLALLLILLVLTFNGILMTDIVRNLWAWSGNENALTSGFTEMLVGK
jgi:hypothetical protein